MAIKPLYEDIFPHRKTEYIKCIWNPPQIYRINLAYHNELEIHYIKKGNGSYFIKNKNYSFSKNHLIIIKNREIHSFIPRSSSYIEKGCILFSPSIVNKDKELKLIIETCPHNILLDERETILTEFIFKNIASETINKKPLWGKIAYAEISLLLFMIKRCTSRKLLVGKQNPLIENITAYLEENFTKNLSLSDIAKTFFLSVSRVSHIFKEETGLSLKHYVMHRRIIEAKKFLEENTDMKVSTISSMVGFNNFSLFNQSFKKITGLTPTDYRKISQQQ